MSYFYQTPNNHLSQKHGCPICKQNHRENLIYVILKENNFNIIPQHKFDNCIYKRKLQFDFYLPDLNIIIEYDGVQHFQSIDYFGGDENFKIQEIKDDIKNSYCQSNNISMIRLPYWLSDKEIEEILLNDINQILKDNNSQQPNKDTNNRETSESELSESSSEAI